MASYNPSTRERIADISRGIHVKTGSLAAATYLLGAANTQTELFTVKGLIAVRFLFAEVLTALDANATQLTFNCTFTTPVIAVNPMAAKCASLANAAAGLRVMWVGGAVATANIITDSAGLTDVDPAGKRHWVGGESFAGTIGMLASDASQAGAGAIRVHLMYEPIYDGSYAEALL